MVTRIRGKTRLHLYIEEWQAIRDLTDERLADRLGVARNTVWRWKNEQHRLNPEKIGAIAEALGLAPEELWHPPLPKSRPSLDRMVADTPDDVFETTMDIVKRLVQRRGS